MSAKNSDFLDSPTSKLSKAKLTPFQRFCQNFCPCFGKKKGKAYRQDVSRLNVVHGTTETNELQDMPKVPTDDLKTQRKPKNLFQSAIQTAPVKDDVAEYLDRRRTIPAIPETHPILNFHEGETLFLGRHPTFKILTRISSVRLSPSRHLLEKHYENPRPKVKGLFTNPKMDAFWSKRYLLFQKFDMGIRIDENSWEHALPQVVADYLGERCQCDTVLDAYSGVGSAAIKFSSRCRSVLTANANLLRLECMDINTRLYAADNIIKLNEEFLQLKNIKSDVVFIWPEWSEEHFELSENEGCLPQETRALLEKALSIAPNFVLLMLPNTDVDRLAETLSSVLSTNKNSSCSVQLQKIYYMQKLQYIACYYGPLVNRQLKLSDELEEVYKVLNEGQGSFHHVRVVKEIRQQFGMMFLLQLACSCRESLASETIQAFYEKIRQRRLIPTSRLQGLILQQKSQPGRVLWVGRRSMAEHSNHTKSDTSNCSLNGQSMQLGEVGMRDTRSEVHRFNNQ